MPSVGVVYGELKLTDQMSAKLDIAATKMDKVGKRWKAVGAGMESVGRSMALRVSAPIIGVAAAASKMSSGFETSLTKMRTLVGLSDKDVKGFVGTVKSLAGETARAPKELADAMFFITSAGLRGAEALETLKLSAQAAALGLGQTEVIADAVTSAMNAYSSSGMSATRATNIMALAVRAGKLEASALAPVLGQLLPIASGMGIAFEDVAGSLAVMSRTGLNASEATTSLRAIFTTFLKPTKQAADALDIMGLSQSDLLETVKKPGGLIEVIRTLNDKIQEHGGQLTDVVPNVRALSGVMNVLAQDGGIVDDVMRQVASGVNIVGQGMGIVSETQGFKFQQVMTQGKLALIELGDALAPFMKKMLDMGSSVMEVLGGMAAWFGKLPTGIQAMVLGFVALLAAAGPLLIALGAMVGAVGTLTTAMAGGAGMAAAGGLTTKALALMMQPLGALPGMLSGAIPGMLSAAKAAKAMSMAFAFSPIGIAMAVGAAALAVSSFISKEGGLLETYAAKGAASVRELRGEWDKFGTTMKQQGVAADFLVLAMAKYRTALIEGRVETSLGIDVIKDSIAAGDSWEITLSKLARASTGASVDSKVLKTILIEVSGEINAAARASNALALAAQQLAEDEAAVALKIRLATEAAEAQKELLLSLGFVTADMAEDKMVKLEAAYATGIVTSEQMRDRSMQLRDELETQGLLTADLAERLDRLSGGYISAKDKVAEMLAAHQALGPQLDDTRARMGGVETATVDTAAGLEIMANRLGLAGVAVENLTGKWPLATGELAKFFGEIRTGNDAIDGLLGTLGKWLGMFGRLIDMFGSGAKAAGNFFTKFSSGLGDLFSGGGGGGGGGGFGDILGSLKGLFGGGGQEAGVAFIGGAAVTLPGLAATGADAATGFLGSLSGILGNVANLMPIIGPFLAMFGGPLLKGIKALAGKIWGALKGMFGGPGAAELASRDIRSEFITTLETFLTGAQLVEAAGKDWAISGVAISTAMAIVGRSTAEADAAFDAFASNDPKVVEGAVADLVPVFDQVREAMEITGLSMGDLLLRVQADSEAAGSTMAEALARILGGVEEIVTEGAARWEEWTDGMARSMDRATDRITERIMALGLPADVAARRIARAMERAAGRIETRFEETPDIVSTSMASAAGRIESRYEVMYDKITNDASLSTKKRERMLERLKARQAAAMEAMEGRAGRTSRALADDTGQAVDRVTARYDTMYKKITDDASLSTKKRKRMLERLKIRHDKTAERMESKSANAAQAMEDNTLEAVDNITKGMDEAFSDLRYDVDFDFKNPTGGNPSGGNPDVPSYATGGFGQFGTGTLAMLHGPEFIVPANKAGQFAAAQGGGGDDELLQEIRQLSDAMRRSNEVRSVRERDRSLMGK